MAGETSLTIIGNITNDLELRNTSNGRAYAQFTIASTPRTYNRQSNQWEDGQPLFMRCTAWADLAQHCAQSLGKGMRVIAQGRMMQRSYEAKDGSKRTVIEMQVDEIGPSLRYATAQVTKVHANRGFQAGSQPPAPPAYGAQTYQPQPQNFNNPQNGQNAQPTDPWSGNAGGFGNPDDPEF